MFTPPARAQTQQASRQPGASVAGAAGGALDLHWVICDAEARETALGCARSRPEHRLISDCGQVVRVRCKATNLCLYCRRLAVIETVEMLMLDAMRWAPTIGVVLTAREHLERRDTYAHLRQLRRAAKRRWPEYEHFVQVEFQLRGAMHLNLIVKGVPAEEVAAFRGLVVLLWCSRVEALPEGQWVRAFSERLGGAQGFVKYVSKIMAHGLKASQAPAIGWRGHRTSQTGGYFAEGAAAVREEARASLLSKRELWKVLQDGHTGEDAERLAQLRVEFRQSMEWTFITSRTIATESGWRELAGEMSRRDVAPALTWDALDDELRQAAAEDDSVLAFVRQVFGADAVLERGGGAS